MGRLKGKRPSPAMLVAIIALIFAVAGSSVAAINSLTKKQKSQTRKIAQSEIAKAAPGLSVANAAHAQQADGVPGGSIGPAELSKSIPAVHVTRTGTPQALGGGVQTTLAFNSERYDTAGMHENTTDNSRLTAPIDGIYSVTAQIVWEPGTEAEHELFVRKNGSPTIAETNDVTTGNAQSVATQVRLQAGDYVEAEAYQESGDGIDVQLNSEVSPEFAMTWLAPGP
jgi:hypothetical protein